MNIYEEQKIALKENKKAVANKPRQRNSIKYYYNATEVFKRYSDFILVLLFLIMKYLTFYQILHGI